MVDVAFTRRSPYASGMAQAIREMGAQEDYAAQVQNRRAQGELDDVLRSGILNIRARQAPAGQQLGNPAQVAQVRGMAGAGGPPAAPAITGITASPGMGGAPLGGPGSGDPATDPLSRASPRVETPVMPLSRAVGGLQGDLPDVSLPIDTSMSPPPSGIPGEPTPGIVDLRASQFGGGMPSPEIGGMADPRARRRVESGADILPAIGASIGDWYRAISHRLAQGPTPPVQRPQMVSPRSMDVAQPRSFDQGAADRRAGLPQATVSDAAAIAGGSNPGQFQGTERLTPRPAPQPVTIPAQPSGARSGATIPPMPPAAGTAIPPQPGEFGPMSDAGPLVAPQPGDQVAMGLPPTEGRPTANNPMALTTGQRSPSGRLMFRNWDNPQEGVQVAQAQLRRNAGRLQAAGLPVTAVTLTTHPQYGWAAGDPRNLTYPVTIARHTGLPVSAPLDLSNPQVLDQVTRGIIQQEGISGGGGVAMSAPAVPAMSLPQPSAAPARQPVGYDWGSLARQAATVPGGGALALRLLEQSERGDVRNQAAGEALERLAITSAARGDVEEARYLAQRAGLNLPPALLENATFARGTLLAERMYRGEPDQAMTFATAYARSGGNVDQALQAAGAPRSNPHLSYREFRDADRVLLLQMDRQGNVGVVAEGRNPQFDLTQMRIDGQAARAQAQGGARNLSALAARIADQRAGGEGLATSEEIGQAYRELRASGNTRDSMLRMASRMSSRAGDLAGMLPVEIRAIPENDPRRLQMTLDYLRPFYASQGGAQAQAGNPATVQTPSPSATVQTPQRYTPGETVIYRGQRYRVGADGDTLEPLNAAQ